MKRVFWMAAAAAAASLSLTACERREPARVEAVQPAAPGQLVTVEGVVTELESDEIEITVPGAGEMDFEFDESVGIDRRGLAVERGAMTEGAQVRASYNIVDGRKNLVRLELLPPTAE